MSTTNLTPMLASVAASAIAWPREEFLSLLSVLASAHEGATIDWDEGVPENWGRVIVDTEVMAIVFCLCPFAVVSSALNDYDAPTGVTVLVVDDMEVEEFSADRATVESLIGRPITSDWDAERFSIDDLWWATVT